MIKKFNLIIERYIAGKIPLMYIDGYDEYEHEYISNISISTLIENNDIPVGFYTWGNKITYDNFMHGSIIRNISVSTGVVSLNGHIKNMYISELIKKSCYEWNEKELSKFFMLSV